MRLRRQEFREAREVRVEQGALVGGAREVEDAVEAAEALLRPGHRRAQGHGVRGVGGDEQHLRSGLGEFVGGRPRLGSPGRAADQHEAGLVRRREVTGQLQADAAGSPGHEVRAVRLQRVGADIGRSEDLRTAQGADLAARRRVAHLRAGEPAALGQFGGEQTGQLAPVGQAVRTGHGEHFEVRQHAGGGEREARRGLLVGARPVRRLGQDVGAAHPPGGPDRVDGAGQRPQRAEAAREGRVQRLPRRVGRALAAVGDGRGRQTPQVDDVEGADAVTRQFRQEPLEVGGTCRVDGVPVGSGAGEGRRGPHLDDTPSAGQRGKATGHGVGARVGAGRGVAQDQERVRVGGCGRGEVPVLPGLPVEERFGGTARGDGTLPRLCRGGVQATATEVVDADEFGT